MSLIPIFDPAGQVCASGGSNGGNENNTPNKKEVGGSQDRGNLDEIAAGKEDVEEGQGNVENINEISVNSKIERPEKWNSKQKKIIRGTTNLHLLSNMKRNPNLHSTFSNVKDLHHDNENSENDDDNEQDIDLRGTVIMSNRNRDKHRTVVYHGGGQQGRMLETSQTSMTLKPPNNHFRLDEDIIDQNDLPICEKGSENTNQLSVHVVKLSKCKPGFWYSDSSMLLIVSFS